MLEVVEDSTLPVTDGLYIEVELLEGYRALEDSLDEKIVPTETIDGDCGEVGLTRVTV